MLDYWELHQALWENLEVILTIGFEPRHTCDFSVFRIYANKDNEPSEISSENIPYEHQLH